MLRLTAIVRIGIALLLIAAAGLKFYGLGISAMPSVGLFAQPWVQLAVAEWELVLGLWLLSGSFPKASWFAAVGTFLTFAGVSGYLGFTGVASCGCLGVVAASPWWAFGIDAAVLAMLALARPMYQPATSANSGRATLVGTVAVVLAISTAAGAWFFGSPEVALARLRGDSVTVSPEQLDLGVGPIATTLISSVEVHNWTDEPLRVYGGTSDCGCIATSDLPITIPPQETRAVSVRMNIPNSAPGTLSRKVELLTDHPRQSTLRFGVYCRVVE